MPAEEKDEVAGSADYGGEDRQHPVGRGGRMKDGHEDETGNPDRAGDDDAR